MANTWFNSDYYLSSKLAQLQKTDPTNPLWQGSNALVNLNNALSAAGYTPESHFLAFGSAELTSPNQYFNAEEYLAAKALQANATQVGGKADWTAQTIALAIKNAGLSIYQHFQQFGWKEGVNPSNAFDVNAYLDAKLTQLQTDEPAKNWTKDSMIAAFNAAGLDPVSHALQFAAKEGLTVVPAEHPVDAANGITLTLTTEQDTIVGTAGNDIINVVPFSGTFGLPVSTLQSFDSIDGGAGKDTLNLYTAQNMFGGANTAQVGTVKNVEIINIHNTSGAVFGRDNGGIDASKFVGVEQLWQIDGATNIDKLSSSTTAGFRGDGQVNVNIAAAVGSSAINVAFDQADQYWANLDVDGNNLNTVNLGGTLTYAGEDCEGNATVEKGWVNLNVNSGSGTKFTLNSSLNVDLDVYANNFSEVDASASTGDISVYAGEDVQLQTITTGSGDDYVSETYFATTATQAATISTGAGDDHVDLETTGAGKTTVNLADGDDLLHVYGASKTLVINAGAGDDDIWFANGFQAAGGTVTVDAGDGDDTVDFNGQVMAEILPTWSIKGGAGTDTIAIGAGVSRVFNAGDYVTLTETISGFEMLNLLDNGGGNTFGIDASRLNGYSEINLRGDGSTLVVNKADASKATIGLYDLWGSGEESSNLVLTADAYAAGTAHGKDLAAHVGGDEITLNVRGNSLALDVEYGHAAFVTGADLNANGVVTDGTDSTPIENLVKNDVKSLSVTLNTVFSYNDNGTPCNPDDDVANGISSKSGVSIDTFHFTDALTSITLNGQGYAAVTNEAGSKLATVNAADLSSVDFNDQGAQIAANGLFYGTYNGGVAETVTLGAGIDTIVFGAMNASSWAKMDTITGLNLVDDAKISGKQLDVSSDLIKLGVNFDDNADNNVSFAKLSDVQASAVNGLTSLSQAMSYVAQLDKDAQHGTVFTYGGNTYAFVDTVVAGGDNQLDDGDFVVKLTGSVDLDLLAASLNPVAVI